MTLTVTCRPSRVPCRREAFSLVEVVVAAGIFAVGIVAVLGLFAPITQSVRASGDAEAAAGATDVLLILLRTEPVPTVIGYLKTPQEFYQDETGSGQDSSADGRIFYASLAGDKIGRHDDPVWGGSDRDKYFEFTLIRNEDLSPADNDVTAAWLAFTVRVRWPAFLPAATGGANQVGIRSPGATARDHGQQQALVFAGSIRR